MIKWESSNFFLPALAKGCLSSSTKSAVKCNERCVRYVPIP